MDKRERELIQSNNRIGTFVENVMPRLSQQGFIKTTLSYPPELQETTFLTAFDTPIGREYILEEIETGDNTLPDSVTQKGKYWLEISKWEELSSLGLELNMNVVKELFTGDRIKDLYNTDFRGRVFLKNILRSFYMYPDEYEIKEKFLNKVSRALGPQVIDLLYQVERDNMREDTQLGLINDLKINIENSHTVDIYKYLSNDNRFLISPLILSDTQFWKNLNVKYPENLSSEEINRLNISLARIYLENINLIEESLNEVKVKEKDKKKKTVNLEKEKDIQILLARMLALRNSGERRDLNIFDYLSHSSFASEERKELIKRFSSYGLSYEPQLVYFLLKNKENVKQFISLEPGYWLSSQGVNILRDCMIFGKGKANYILDTIIQNVNEADYTSIDYLTSLKGVLNIGASNEEVDSTEDVKHLPEDSFLGRLNMYFKIYLGDRDQLIIENPPDSISEIRDWLFMANDLRDKTDILQIILDKYGSDSSMYVAYRDMLNMSSPYNKLTKDERNILSWLKSLNPTLPQEREVINKLWESIKKNVPFVREIRLDTLSKRDLLVLSSLVIMETIEETNNFNLLSKLLERGIPQYKRISDPRSYKLKKSFTDFIQKFKEFGFSGNDEEIALFYKTYQALSRLDQRGLSSEVFIDSKGIRVYDPKGTLISRKKIGKETIEPYDPMEDKSLTWEQIRDSTYEVDYTFGSEIWSDIQATFRLVTFGAKRSELALKKGKQTPSQKARKKAYGEIRFILPGTSEPALILPPVKDPDSFAKVVQEVARSITKVESSLVFDQAMEILHKENVEEKKSQKK